MVGRRATPFSRQPGTAGYRNLVPAIRLVGAGPGHEDSAGAAFRQVHGNNFWQTDYDVAGKDWSRTYNVPLTDRTPHTIRLTGTP